VASPISLSLFTLPSVYIWSFTQASGPAFTLSFTWFALRFFPLDSCFKLSFALFKCTRCFGSVPAFKAGNEIHLYVVPATNLLILFCVRIEVRRVKRSQFDAVRTMLERCVIRKVVVQSFHPRDNTLPNSHNRSTKKINDMSMSVRDEKISSEIVDLSMRVVTTSDRRICNSSTASIY